MTAQEQAGRALFFDGAHCNICHTAPFFSNNTIVNIGSTVGFADQGQQEATGLHTDFGKFKNTTLRNIEVTGPYMHDGRFGTLEEVVDFYADSISSGTPNLDNHMQPFEDGQLELDAADRAALVAFMKALTDTEFLTNPAFSDPN